MTATIPSGLDGPGGPGGAAAGLLASMTLLVLLVAGGLLFAVVHIPQREWRAAPEVPVALGGEHYRVSPAELEALERFSAAHFEQGREGARAAVAAEIDRGLDAMFAHAEQRLPEFADWYYSLRGEYSRMAMGALAAARVADPGYAAGRAAEMLFPEDAWSDSLGRVGRSADARLTAREAQDKAQWIAEVARRLSAHRVPAPLPGSESSAAARVELDRLVADIAREHDALDRRMAASGVAAGGAALGPMLWRAVAARTASAAGRAAAGRAAAESAAERWAARGAARAGSAAAARAGSTAAAAGGAAVCAPGGPIALGCALVAGAAAWVGTDWALLAIDEHLHRDDLLKALDAGLAGLRAEIEQELLGSYDALIGARYGAVEDEIHRSFVPARASSVPHESPSPNESLPPSESTLPSSSPPLR
jgi:hypothetical protein